MNFTDIAYITNGTLISLMNTQNKNYVALDSNINVFKLNGIHPFLINKDYEKENLISSEFYIFQSSSPNKNKNILTFGTQVTIMTKDQMCLVATNNGEVRLEALKGDKTLNSYNFPQNSKFTLIDPFNNNNISKPLLFNDEIILRSTFGSYLILNSFDISMNSNGMIISEETIWKIIKTNIPFMPEWTSKRKYLNFNNISYLYNLEKNLDSKDPKKSQKNDSNLNQSAITNPSDPKDKMSLLTLSA